MSDKMAGTMAILRAGGYSAPTHIFTPPEAAFLTAGARGAAAVANLRLKVTYHGFTAEAKAAFQAAVDVWAVLLRSTQEVRVDATWTALDAGVLGQAGPANIFKNFATKAKKDTWYAAALACKLAKKDLGPGEPHITAEFSSVFPNWHFGTSGPAPADKYDFMSVVLHELGHGIGFVGSAQVKPGGKGSWGWGTPNPAVWDRFIRNADAAAILDEASFPIGSKALAGQLQSSRLFFDGPKARAANQGSPVRIYAPMTWEDGSSYSHLDEVTFPPGSSNSLMTPQIGMGETIHAPGQIGMAMLRDLGW
jgi:hypothetical protein